MRRWRIGLVVTLLTAIIGVFGRVPQRVAAVDPLCFDAPGIVNCIGATFRPFWEDAGGLAAFGYPLTPTTFELTADGAFLTQYFERARFESHPENPFEYQVQLGRLGAELYTQNAALELPQPGCQYFGETDFNLCEPFLTKWQTAPGTPGASSTNLYGLPISPLILSSDANGAPISLQWFERARFELHGDNLILLGLVGREILDQPTPEPTPAPTPPVPPTPEPIVEPTPVIPPPIEAPFPARPCHINVPAPIEGIQAWPTLPEVSPPNDQVICVRLIVNGQPAHPAFVNIYSYTPDGVIAGIGHTTGFDGTTGFIFYVGDLPINATIPVEAVATFEGREYRVWTSFVRR